MPISAVLLADQVATVVPTTTTANTRGFPVISELVSAFSSVRLARSMHLCMPWRPSWRQSGNHRHACAR